MGLFDKIFGKEKATSEDVISAMIVTADAAVDNGDYTNGIGERLRTFSARDFVFDGVECASIGSVLEAFKFTDIDKQEEIAAMSTWDAYHAGQTEEAAQWQMTRILHWNGNAYNRDEPEYKALLRRLFYSVFEQDAQFRLDVAFLKDA